MFRCLYSSCEPESAQSFIPPILLRMCFIIFNKHFSRCGITAQSSGGRGFAAQSFCGRGLV